MRPIPETYIVFLDGEPDEAFGYPDLAEAHANKLRAGFKAAGHDAGVEVYKAYVPDLMRVLKKTSL